MCLWKPEVSVKSLPQYLSIIIITIISLSLNMEFTVGATLTGQ